MTQPEAAAGGTAICIASTGGHLAQLRELQPRLRPAAARRIWVTFDDAQSRSLLAGEDVRYIPELVGRKDPLQIARLVPFAIRLLRSAPDTFVVSTGAGIAVPFAIAAAIAGRPMHYIETASRFHGPSITGKIMMALPTVRRYTQHESWAGKGWQYRGSIIDGYAPIDAPAAEPGAIRKIVVAVGVNSEPFTAVVNRLREILPTDAEVTWQTGATPVSFPEATPFLPSDELRSRIAEADLVIAHAGFGSALDALRAGVRPVVIPRSAARGEHLDDHQQQLARTLGGKGLAVPIELEDLTWERLVAAAHGRIGRSAEPRPLQLDPR